ncbi:MAG: glycosyltransferase family 39 protein [Planctomycetes bacterium]|nr:glycosyltransferase family 39 protein [Planctomycetota bacterium]
MFNSLWFGAVHCRRLFAMQFIKHPMLLLPIISILAGVGTLIFAHQRTGSIDGYAFSSLDGREYYQLATNLAHHGRFSQSESPPFDPDTWRTPGYPLFLALHLFIGDNSSLELIVVQQLLNLINSLLLAFMAMKYMSTRRALLVGLLFVFEPYHHFYSLWLMPTTLFVTVLLLIWHVWHRAAAPGRWQWSALLGALTGFAVLLRPVSILLPVVVLAGLGIEWFRQREKRKVLFRAFGVTLAAMMLIVGAWVGRNKVVAGRFALSHQSGIVLSYFKATEVMLWRLGRTADRYAETSLDPEPGDQPHIVWDDIDARLRNHFADLPAEQLNQLQWPKLAQGNKTDLDSFEVSAALRSIGLEMLLQEPLSTLACCFVRCFSILTFPLNLAICPPAEPYAPDRLVAAAKGGIYLALLVWVLVRLFMERPRLEQVYFPLACTLALLLASTPQLDPRFRVPMIPLLLFVALLPRRKHLSKENPH